MIAAAVVASSQRCTGRRRLHRGCFPEIERVRMMGLLSPPDTAELSRELGVSGRRLNKIQQFLADQIIKRRVHPIA
jgi:hypothetical protein